jgi:gamma-D-glutamyl-L-lysine dipeptidyl-peptidase
MRQLYFLVFAAMIAAGCSNDNAKIVRINRTIDSLTAVFRPDARTAVFSVAVEKRDNGFVLLGETDNPAAKSALISKLNREIDANFVDSVRVLPDISIGPKAFGIVDVSVGNVRAVPKSAGELVNQVLMGHIVRILKEARGWLYVKSEDDYLGWIEQGSIVRSDSSTIAMYAATRKLFVTPVFARATLLPHDGGGSVSDLVMADMLIPVGIQGTDFKVKFPDGRIGYVPRSAAEYYDTYMATHKPTPSGIEAVAREMLGFPYLWGGTSSKGVDCSGFTKTVFRMNGITLPRDASQQVNVGRDIEPGQNFGNLRTGDLLFFGDKADGGKPERIVHVAIYLHDGYFIQASNRVRISSLLKNDTAFDQYDLDRFVRVKRVLPSQNK